MENDPLIGKQLGAYSIQSKIGEGGMAQVYKAYHARLRREVAIKVILPEIADQSGFRERFEREAQLVASLEQRNIVAVYDFGEIGNLTYLVMQYVGGGTLRDLLRKEGSIEPHKAVQYAIQMARALHHAHQRGIVHRDVKPQNMLISTGENHELLLSDFGIAKLFDSSSQETILQSASGSVKHNPSLTSVDQMVGTAEYMAPEQINRQPVDARTDVYALGIVLFQMLTGQIPFSSTTVDGLLYQHVFTPPKAVREVNPNVPEVIEKIIFRALAKAPEHRFQSAEAMALALETIHTSSTHELSDDTYSTFGRDEAPYLSQNRTLPSAPSYYGHPPTPTVGAKPAWSQPAAPRNTTGGSSAFIAPARPQTRNKFRLSYLMYIVVLIVAIVLAATRVQPWLCTSYSLVCFTSSQTSPGGNTPFTTEDFHNNDHHWIIGNQDNGNLTADISNNQYTLAVGHVSNTYFPHPDPMGTASGPLPQNFTLTVKMAQTQGSSNILFGIAFRLQGDDTHVSSYVFSVDTAGSFDVFKYTPDNPGPGALKSGTVAINATGQSNTLQVIARGSTFSFYVNGRLVPLAGTADHSFTDSDHPLSGGQLGIYVTGPNASFSVTSVVLTR
jgi:serine/threonine protein kinase